MTGLNEKFMRSFIGLLFVFLAFSGIAQKALPKFGEVSMEEMKMDSYTLDSSATAVILFDKGETVLSEDLNVSFKRHVRIKIFTKGGFEWADHAMRIQHVSQSVSKLKGSTYNLEGGNIVESKMIETSIFKSKYNKYRDQIKFTLPNVKEGSIIEYSYVLRSTASLLPDWQFQYTIPVVWSEYDTSIPTTFSFRKDMQGFLPITKHEQKGDTFEHFVMADVPAFKEEPFITTPDDYVAKIHFYISELFIPGRPIIYFNESWEKIVKEHIESKEFGQQIKGSGFLNKTVDELTAGMVEPEKKLQAIYDYVKASVVWNGDTDRIPDHTFKKVLEDKKGSSSEINLMLVSMLQKAGLSADPVFLSTRDNGMVRSFTNQVDQFNDVICVIKIKEKQILVDATDKDLPMSALPQRCINGSGLIVSEIGPDWIEITSARSRQVITAELKIDEAGELTGQLTLSYDGIAGGVTRKSYKELGEEKYVKALLEGKTWEVDKSEFNNMTNPSQSVREKHKLVIRDHAQASGAVIYLNPFVMDRMEENKFKSEKRLYPVDFATPFEILYLGKISIPDGFVVEELPKPKVLTLPGNGGKYVYNLSLIGNTLSITSQFSINRSLFTQNEYPVLREFYNQVVAKQAEQIVLKKK